MTEYSDDNGERLPRQWTNRCVLCVPRTTRKMAREMGREPTIEEVHAKVPALASGHVCDHCRGRARTFLADVIDLAATASADIEPGRGGNGARAAGYESKPPLNLHAIDPALTIVNPDENDDGQETTVLELLESWERVVRDDRGLARYGPASAARASTFDTNTTLTGVVRFLTAHLDWMTATPDFPIEAFDHDLRACVTALKRYEATPPVRVVACPTVNSDGTTCGRRLRVQTWAALDHDTTTGDRVWCKSCGTIREPTQLLAAAGADDVYADAAALAEHFGVKENTIRQWGRRGKIERRGSLYRWGDVADLVRRSA